MTNEFRHTPETIEELVANEQYHTFPGTNITVCLLKLVNGFVILGHSACVHDKSFDAELGRRVSRNKALNEVWLLEGYLEANRQHLLGNTSKGQPLDSEGADC